MRNPGSGLTKVLDIFDEGGRKKIKQLLADLNMRKAKKDHLPQGALTIGRALVSFVWSGVESVLS